MPPADDFDRVAGAELDALDAPGAGTVEGVSVAGAVGVLAAPCAGNELLSAVGAARELRDPADAGFAVKLVGEVATRPTATIAATSALAPTVATTLTRLRPYFSASFLNICDFPNSPEGDPTKQYS